MALERISPESIHEARGYTHVVKATGGTTVYISGQVGIDRDGNLVGRGDLEAQARQAYANLGRALDAVGATQGDVAKITTFVVNYSPEARPALTAARQEVFGGELPASTLVGVQALAAPDLMVEVEAVAVID